VYRLPHASHPNTPQTPPSTPSTTAAATPPLGQPPQQPRQPPTAGRNRHVHLSRTPVPPPQRSRYHSAAALTCRRSLRCQPRSRAAGWPPSIPQASQAPPRARAAPQPSPQPRAPLGHSQCGTVSLSYLLYCGEWVNDRWVCGWGWGVAGRRVCRQAGAQAPTRMTGHEVERLLTRPLQNSPAPASLTSFAAGL
jgi:hypothetical protein